MKLFTVHQCSVSREMYLNLVKMEILPGKYEHNLITKNCFSDLITLKDLGSDTS